MNRKWIFLACFLLVSSPFFAFAQIFSEIAHDAGINFVHHIDRGWEMGGGGAILDFDNDGWEDVYIAGGWRNDRIYHNLGNGNFQRIDIFQNGGDSINKIVTNGAIAGDVNNDGFTDVFVPATHFYIDSHHNAHNLLYRNNGDGTFSDISAHSGIASDSDFTYSASFCDYNLDGFLDICVGNVMKDPASEMMALVNGVFFNLNVEGLLLFGMSNKFYINNGNWTFTEMSEVLAVNDSGATLSSVWTDYDNDYDLDLFLSNDFTKRLPPNNIYDNQYPSDGFLDIGQYTETSIEGTSMGISSADHNEDGIMDFYITNIGPNFLYRGNARFSKSVISNGS